jgi:invasion protein IalB
MRRCGNRNDAALVTCAGVRGLALALLLGISAGADAQDLLLNYNSAPSAPLPEVQWVERWTIVCRDARERKSCDAEQSDEASQTALVVLPPRGPAKTAAATLVVRVPLGMLVAEGIALRLDGKAVGRLAIRTCDRDGCIAPLVLSGRIGHRVLSAHTAILDYGEADGGRRSAKYDLAGLSEAIRHIGRNVPAKR